ncbi:ABC1 family-domain-containing protein [Powellomyces hirtus]|nr:ABC1 family-domain-containing protein [Powellomyces hirtus]
MFRSLAHRPLLRRGLLLTTGITTAWAADKYAYDSTIQRNVRTLYNGALITADYKWNFVEGNAANFEALHERVANRILSVCKENGGLYIKFGQQIAAVPVLPAAYNKTFKVLFDDAPAVSYAVVEKIIKEELGQSPDQIFETFSRTPLASASIAQVHRATLKDGSVVAVKIQKPEIQRQIGWDLFTYKILCRAMEFFFDLPLTWQADYIERHIRQETDFENEARNAELAAKHVREAPGSLSDRIHVPKVNWKYTSKRVMTAEWIEGIRFTNPELLEGKGWSKKEVMRTVVDVFADQIFRSGFIHADPHPGNIIVRKHPTSSRPQVVLLDHGLYVTCSETFKHDYAVFWKAIFSGDLPTIQSIAEGWGVRDVQMFASATLQKPWTPGKAVHVDTSANLEDLFQRQVKMKESVKTFLNNTQSFPKELIFVGRNMNLVRANNKFLGSPVNRINIMANTAVQSLGNSWSMWGSNRNSQHPLHPPSTIERFTQLVTSRINYWTFRATLFFTALVFHMSRAAQKMRYVILGVQGAGFEDMIDGGMRRTMQDQFGVTIDDEAFSG